MNFTSQIVNHPHYQDTDIVRKSKKYDQFYEELLRLEESYINDLNMAIYADLDDLESLGVFVLRRQEEHLFISFFGYLMPEGEDFQAKFYLLWVRTLDEVLREYLGKKYTIIYYHSLCQESLSYEFLVMTFKKLPIYYYAMLNKIYTIETTFFMRKSTGLLDFGRLFKLFERKLQHVQKLREFAFMPDAVKYKLLNDMPEKLMNVWKEKVKRKNLKWGENQHEEKSMPLVPVQPPKKDFLRVKLDQHKLSKDLIPVPLSILLRTLKTNPDFLSLEGIFRKSGSVDEQEMVMEELQEMNEEDSFKNIEEYTGYSIAGVVVRFFSRLTQPIVPFAVYDRLMGVLSVSKIEPQNEITFILEFMDELPLLNCQVLFYFLTFLKREIISRQQVNKMNNYNMAVCIFPSIFISKTTTANDLINSGKFVGLIKIIFTRFDEIQVQVHKKFGIVDESKPKALQFYRISLA